RSARQLWYCSGMDRLRFFLAALLFVVAATLTPAQNPAPTPPMGWNSWDAYGLTINEADFKANAAVLATVKQFGWQYAVIDEGWYMENPNGRNLAERKYLLDANGILLPVVSRFPTSANGAGFKPLADWVHAQGLKFGIHIVRGIPRDAVKANLPIAGTSFHAADAADLNSPCGWDEGNWGVADNAAGQAYYDSMLKLYAGWGLDFLKVDCISDHPYRPTEIRQIAEAIGKTGRPIVLSLSPGPTQIEHAAEVAQYAQMWRITNDHWDAWSFPRHPGDDEYPFGLRGEFDRLAQWAPYVKSGNWPDADMLPWGSLTPHPGMGEPRQSRLTRDEQQTEFTLWAIARSPLILGANLTKLDDFTRSLMTNKDAIEINQKAVKGGEAATYPDDPLRPRYWWAVTGGSQPKRYIAVFNLKDTPQNLDVPWIYFHLADKDHAVYDVWNKKHIPAAKSLRSGIIPAHGCALYRVE
ncbi:MAG: glycoside hydrolase family 27 protein, partial [Terracidiphilus sp.]